MDSEKQFKLFTFVLEVRRKIQNNFLALYSIKAVQFIWVFGALLNSLHSHLFPQNEISKRIMASSFEAIMNQTLFEVCYAGLIIFAFFTILNIVVYIRTSPGLFRITPHKKIQEITINCATFNVWLSEIFIYPAAYSIMNSSLNGYHAPMVLKGSALFLIYFTLIGTISNFSLSGRLTLVTSVTLFNHNGSVFKLLVSFMLILYQFLTTNSKLSRIFLTPIITSVLSMLFTQIFGTLLDLDDSLIFFYIILLNAGLILYIMKFNKFIGGMKELSSFESIFEKIDSLPLNEKLSDRLNLDEFVSIYNFMLKMSRQIDINFHAKINDRLTIEIPIRSIYDISEEILSKLIHIKDSYIHKLNLLECMLVTGKTLSQIYEFINVHDINISKVPFQYKVKYVKIIEKLKQKYGICATQSQLDLQVSVIQQVDRMVVEFQQDARQMMCQQIEFWETFLEQKIDRNEFENKYLRLEKLRKRINKNKRTLSKLNLFKRFRHMYRACQKNFLQYDHSIQQDEIQIDNEQQQIFRPWELQSFSIQQPEQISDKFMIIQDQKIMKISHSLGIMLKIHTTDYELRPLTDLFGRNVTEYLKDKMGYLTTKSQKEWFQLPLFVDKYMFVALKVRILWVPTLQGMGTYMLEVGSVSNTSFLYYDVQKNEICYFSDHFIKEFSISEKIMNKFIDLQQLKYEKIFLHSFSTSFSQSICQMSKKYKQRQKSYVPLQMHIQKLSENAYSINEIPSFKKVYGKTYDYIYMGDTMFTILEIKSFRLDSVRDLWSQYTGTLGALPQETIDRRQVNQNETFFCKISNSYENKITEKLESLRNSTRMKGWMRVLLLGGIFTILWASESFYTYFSHASKSQLYEEVWNSLSKNYSKYAMIFDLYKISSEVYQSLYYPDTIHLIDQQSIQSHIQSLKSHQQQSVKQFLSTHLPDTKSKHKNQVNYKVDFESYHVNLTTESSGLMDFVTGFKKNIDENEWDFLLGNYNNFRGLSGRFESYIDLESQIKKEITIQLYLWYGILGIVTLMIIVILVVACRNEIHSKKLVSLYAQIQDEQIVEKIKHLRKDLELYFRKDFETSQEYGLNEKKTVKLLSGRNSGVDHMIEDGQNQVERKGLLQKLRSNDKPSRRKANEESPKKIIQLPFHSIRISSIATDKQNKIAETALTKQAKKQIVTKCFAPNIKYGCFFIVLIACYSCLVSEYVSLREQQQKYTHFFELQKSVLHSQLNLHQVLADTFVVPVYKDYFGQELEVEKYSDNANVQMNIRFETDSGFAEIKNAQDKLHKELEKDLCTNENYFTEELSSGVCRVVGDGVLTRGYSSSFIYSLQMSQTLSTQPLKSIQSGTCTVQNFTLYDKFSHITEVLSQIIDTAIFILRQQFDRINSSYEFQRKRQLLWRILAGLICMMGMVLFVYNQKKRGQRTLVLFKFFPKFVANKIRVSKFIRNQHILDSLQMI